MASHSPQRARSSRMPQTHQLNQALAQDLLPRESSRSPSGSIRERRQAQSAAQMYSASSVPQQLNHIPPQASPTGSNNSRPSPPTASISRHHATPPQASGSPNEIGVPPSLSQVPQGTNGYGMRYVHGIGLAHGPPLTRYQNMDDSYQITPELLEEIERADLQQTQAHSTTPPFTNYSRNGSTTPPRDHNLERIRATDRASPKELDSRRQRDPASARESPTVRQSHSPSTFVQSTNPQPDHRASESPARASPLGGGSSGETYTAYTPRDSPAHRRGLNALNTESRAQYSHPAQTPPSQSLPSRPAVRSLPVQEEAEDDAHLTVKSDPWEGLEHFESRHHASSPTPSSELLPEGNTRRFDARHSTATHQEDDSEGSDNEGTRTPRSPSVGLPDRHPLQTMSGVRVPMRVMGRATTMDQLAMRGIDETIYQPTPQAGVRPPPSPTAHRLGHPHQRRLSVDPNVSYYPSQYYADESSPFSGYPHGHPHAQFLPEEYYTYPDPAAQFYPEVQTGDRPRPDAPVPPTPHSQTAAPSPSPFPHLRNGRNGPIPSPIPVAGSPYPYPFNHVRRNMNVSRNAQHIVDPTDPNFDPNTLREQMAIQWRKYAQNTHALDPTMTDSTFSPSSTPYPGDFTPWALLHARRTLGRAFDLRSMQSSPGLDRGEGPPIPPPEVFRKKKKQQPRTSKLSHEIAPQAVPPRVQSTQPRDTSPEPSTSGEETPGEDTYSQAAHKRSSWSNGSTAHHVVEDDGDADWLDEDDEPDDEDYLDLEYHPSYVKNDNKRRRRWEIRWETLLEAFRAVDRQTDATMVLLAAPSHTDKLYSIRSRSIRRQGLEVDNSSDMATMKLGFKRIAAQRRRTRSRSTPSVIDRFLSSSVTSGEGSDASESREEDLKRALEATLSSLRAFEHIFNERETRTAEEMRRISEDRERVELLLKQVLGNSERNGRNTTPTASLL